MRRRIAAIVAAVGILGSVVGGVSASGASDTLVGGYKYRVFNDAPRQVSISAHETGAVKGSWAFGAGKGVVTCLTVDGQEAWAAGPGKTATDPGAFFYVIDGGAGGQNDLVVSWGQDPGQPLEELIGWCETKNTDFPLFAVEQGSVTVVDAP